MVFLAGKMSKTPVAPASSLQGLPRMSTKRQCIDFSSPPQGSQDMERRAFALVDDQSLPSHVRAVISFLLEDRKQLFGALNELRSEVASLRND